MDVSPVKTDGKAGVLVVDDHPIVRQGLADLMDSQAIFFVARALATW